MENWVIIIGAIVAALPGLYAIYRQRNLTDAQATHTIGEAYRALFDELEARITSLQAEVEAIKQERDTRELELTEQIKQLQAELDAERELNKQLRTELDKAQRQIENLQREVRKLKKSTGPLTGDA